MIVYGDPHYRRCSSELIEALACRLGEGAGAQYWSLDTLRSLLIAAGELEQALADALSSEADAQQVAPVLRQSRAVTQYLATAFCSCWQGEAVDPGPLRCAATLVEALRSRPGVPVTVKVPEGFQFYLLYPEQYILAARQWAAMHARGDAEVVLVVGVRTIGTTLSAVVVAALQGAGRRALRTTVRPTGHPFERRAQLDAERVSTADFALVVDEGPGLSGSSMAAVAEALVAAGMDSTRISFLPGHGGEPGSAASEIVRAWWSRAPRFVAGRDALHWEGRALSGALAAATGELEAAFGPVLEVQDLGGGLWRSRVFGTPDLWPAASVPFEAPKFRCACADGSSVLWKFAGLSSTHAGPIADVAVRRLERLAREGWTSPPLGTHLGFVALPWIEATPMTAGDLDRKHLRHLARYLAAASGPPLAPGEHVTALHRLGELLYWNVWEGIGPEAAERAGALREHALSLIAQDLPASYGDGRMAPHEWLRTPDGRVLKSDAAGHDGDHTAIGRQSLAWDVAGTIVEWRLEATPTEFLISELAASGFPHLPSPLLRFYCAAYAAFRLGLYSMGLGAAADDPAEQTRLQREIDRMRAALKRLVR